MMNLIFINTTLIFSVLLGGLIVSSISNKTNEQIIKLMLAFSGGFLLSIAFIHFIPELYENNNLNIGTYILIGFLIQLMLEFFSRGIEHGHIHINKLSKVPVTLFIALSIHALLEGIPLGTELLGIKTIDYHSHNNNTLLLGILLHRLPVSIALMTLLLNSNIGSNCIIKSGAVIGGTGFGFDLKSKNRIQHFGNVIIENNCNIGSNTTIDRAVFDGLPHLVSTVVLKLLEDLIGFKF